MVNKPPPSEPKMGITASIVRSLTVIRLFLTMIFDIWWHHAWSGPGPDQAEKLDNVYRRQAVHFRKTAEALGGILIKVGQFLSSRVDLLPKVFIDEIQSLQDNVAAAPWPSIEQVLVDELGPLAARFSRFDPTPLASASLGQVYRAWLPDGSEVAVKVRRPGIEQAVAADLRAVGFIVALANRFTQFGRTFDLMTVQREFRQSVDQELDYLREAANTERIRTILSLFRWVYVPRTFSAWSSARVLTMEFKSGIKITQLQTLRANGHEPSVLAERLIRMYLHMVLVEGFYHADPHPGNIWVNQQGQLLLFDYGMVGTLDLGFKRQMRKLFIAVAQHNSKALLDSMESLGMVLPRADRVRLRERLRYMLDRYYAETLNQLADLDIARLLHDFAELLHDDAIQVPGELAFLGRTIAILVGLATALDPDINLISLFAPYTQRFMTEEHGGVAGFAADRVRGVAADVAELPELSNRVLHRLDEGDIETQIRWLDGVREIRQLRRSLDRLTHALYVLGFLFIALLLYERGQTDFAALALAASAAWTAYARFHRRRP